MKKPHSVYEIAHAIKTGKIAASNQESSYICGRWDDDEICVWMQHGWFRGFVNRKPVSERCSRMIAIRILHGVTGAWPTPSAPLLGSTIELQHI